MSIISLSPQTHHTDEPAFAGSVSTRRPDGAALVIAAVLAVLAGVIAWDASRLGANGAYARIGPQTMPLVVALGLLGLAGWTVVAAGRRDFPPREVQELRPVAWIVGGLVAQMALLNFAGFSVATGLLFALVARGFGERRFQLSLPVGLVLATLVWFAFAKGLALSLPAGPLESSLSALGAAVFQPEAVR